MQYYRLWNSINSQIVGEPHPLENSKLPADHWDNPNFVDNIQFKRSEIKPITAIGIMHKKGKLTDLIGTVPSGFDRKLLISPMFKELLESYTGDRFQFFDCKIEHGDTVYSYWLLSPVIASFDVVNFNMSTIVQKVRKPEGGTELMVVNVNTEDHYNTEKAKSDLIFPGYFFIQKIKLNEVIPYQLFALHDVEGGAGFYVSETLKQKIESEGITGIEFAPIELTLNEWLQKYREAIYGKP